MSTMMEAHIESIVRKSHQSEQLTDSLAKIAETNASPVVQPNIDFVKHVAANSGDIDYKTL